MPRYYSQKEWRFRKCLGAVESIADTKELLLYLEQETTRRLQLLEIEKVKDYEPMSTQFNG